MAISIPLTGLSQSDPVPGNYLEINFAQGPASAGAGDYSIILLGNRLSTGSAQDDGYIYGPDTQVQLAGEQDAIALFGNGSELHRMYRRAVAINQSTAIYAVCVAESVGSKASGTIVVTGTATASATLRIAVQDESVDVSIVTGDTPTVIGDSIVAAIATKPHWAVTSANSTGTVTVTAKQKGLRGNLIRFSARVLNPCGVSVTPTANATALSGGTTADSNVNALATINSRRFYYQVSAAEDATQLGALANQVDSLSSPLVGVRQRVVAGSVDTLANATTVAVGINKARVEVVWQQDSDLTPGELAAHAAAAYAIFEAPAVPRCNFSGFGQDAQTQAYWQVKAPRKGTAPTRAQLVSALNNGLTPIGVGKGSASYIVKRITSRSLNGSVSDYRIRDAHKVTISDRFGDDLVAKQIAQLSGKKIGDDPLPGQFPPVDVVTPRVLKSLAAALVDDYAANGLLENAATIKENILSVREASPNTRLSIKIPIDIVDILDQVGTKLDQVN